MATLLDRLSYKLGLRWRPPGDERFYLEKDGQKVPVHERYDEQCLNLDTDSDRFLTADELKYLTAEVPFAIDKQRYVTEHVHAFTGTPLPELKDYPDYTQVTQQLQDLVAQHPGRAHLESLGKSHEGREIWSLRMGNAEAHQDAVVTGLTHGREWPSLAIPLALAKDLLENSDPLLERCQVHIVPLVNPDGYEFSRTTDPLWRKNRNPEHPVDLNRNYYDPAFPELYRPAGDKPDSTHDDIGATDNPAYRQYRGKAGGSEPEVQALQKLTVHDPDVKAVLEHHCCGEMLLYPGNGDRAVYQALGAKMKEDLGSSYVVEPTSKLYPVSGTPNDLQQAHGKLGLTMESCLSFQPPAAELAKTLPGAVAASKRFIAEALQ